MTMTKMLAGISKAAVEREAAMMEASSNFIWARKLRALRAALDKAEADNARLRDAIDYILDGMGIYEPDYIIDPDDDFLDAANSEWVRDTLERLASALNGKEANGL